MTALPSFARRSLLALLFCGCVCCLAAATAAQAADELNVAAAESAATAPTPAAAAAESPPAAEPPKQDAAAPASKIPPPKYDDTDPGAWAGDYGRWIKYMERKAMEEMDLWGSSSTIPEGFLVGLFGYGTMRAAQRFDKNRKLIDIIPLFTVPDAFNLRDGRPFFTFNFNARGETRGYLAGLTYGINDTLMVGATTMFADIYIRMDPIFVPGTCERVGVATLEEFYRLLEKLGRPRPKMSYKSDPLDPGDTTLFLTWNYYRSEYFSTAITPKLYLPTAHKAAPDKSIIFALGPDLDTGAAAWGVGLNPVWDFRLPEPAKVVTFSIGAEGAIFAQSERESPKFYAPDRDVLDYLKAQKVELDFFPDLSDIDKHYYYTPPPWVAVSAGIGVSAFSLSYRHGWGFEGSYETNSPGFKKVIKTIGLVGTGDDGRITAAASLPLTPLYLPALAQFRFDYMTDGRNSLVFRDIYQMGVGFLIPIAPPARYRLPPRPVTPQPQPVPAS